MQYLRDGLSAKNLGLVSFLLCALFVVIYPFLPNITAPDFDVFLLAGQGDLTDFYYAPWILPYFSFLTLLPYSLAYAFHNLISVLGFGIALSVFKGNKALFFIAYPLFLSIISGQVDGIYAAGLALMVVALRRDKPVLATVGWILAIIKFYVGIPLGLGLLWIYGRNHQVRLRIILYMAIWCCVSLFVWEMWPIGLWQRLQAVPPHAFFTIDLWDRVGPLVLVLWLPVMLLRIKDYRLWVATWTLTVPYLHIHGLMYILTIPVGGIAWLVQAPYLTGLRPYSYYLLLVPAYLYVTILYRYWKNRDT